MTERTIKMPDIGEGITESEISDWLVKPGDLVREDDPLVVVMTDKAAVEIPSSVSGKVTWLAAEAGEVLPVGAPLLKIDVLEAGEAEAEQDLAAQAGAEESASKQEPEARKTTASKPESAPPTTETAGPAKPRSASEEEASAPAGRSRGKALAAPAVRKRAADLGLDLAHIDGSGPDGRVTHADLDRHLAGRGPARVGPAGDGITETRIIGLRRKIAEQMARAHAAIPAITIVETVDVTELERLRGKMNEAGQGDQMKLTLLPFLIRGMVLARRVAPQVNARYDEEAGVLHTYEAAHVGVAAQTSGGLMVPVLKNAEARSVRDLAAEIARLAEGARQGKLRREELSGSTMTITSLGALGAIASTPIINHPEVAIVGVNRKEIRPVWDGSGFVPREMMNLSASFDHRIVDGWDAAQFIARLKALLETPALLFADREQE